MTTPEERPELLHTESVLTETLDRHAAEAPADDALLSGVHRRLRRRRTGRTISVAVLACAAVAAGVSVGNSLTPEVTPAQSPVAEPQSTPVGEAEMAAKRLSNQHAGATSWRWESYKNVQVQVPASWNNYVSGPAPCAQGPTVGRFGPWLEGRRSCAVAVRPLAERQEYLWFDDVQQPGVKQYDGGWTEETRDVGGVHVSVLTRNDALRKRVLDSAVEHDGPDVYGCTSTDVGGPEAGKALSSLGTVTAVNICEYWGGGVSEVPEKVLISGSRLVGAQAKAVGAALTGGRVITPEGNEFRYSNCSDDGGRTFKITAYGTGGTWSTVVRYSTCYPIPVATTYGQESSPTLVELIRTGVHKPSQLDDLIDVPSGFTPPER
ncbi:hypothetical protein GCM10009789_55170 [Kribbella sancticallisti]|uniref:Uncharacterized protein n=1 Tax=Kribbella sancticallisti TaxID=460087 RepID=A0ABN2E294_9ACTN